MSMKHISDKQVCEAYKIARDINFDRYPYEILQEMTGQPYKVCYRAMERASRRDYIDYGITLRRGWLTRKGEELLK